jgi:LPS-assembly protein
LDLALLAGVAVLAIVAGAGSAALAQTTSFTGKLTPGAPDDGLGPKDVYLEADQVVDDRDTKVVTATGHVEMRYQGRTLRADSVTYNSVTGVAHATGRVVMISADGAAEFATDVTLDDQFRAAVALSFSGHLEQNVTMVAGAAIRRTETVTELNHGKYTPCDICRKDGKTPKTPTWSIEASRIVEDRDKRVIYYRNAVIRVMGVPIFYSPIFWHPDPAAPRQSGLLAPKITYSSYRGLSYSQPYYLDLSPSASVIVAPQIDTRVTPFLNLRYSEKFYSGDIDLRLGYTYEREFNNHDFFGANTSRSYALGRGSFQIDPKWTVGFGLERATDPTLFQRYSVSQIYTDRGPYPTDTDRLISQLFAQRQDNQSFFQGGVLNFQSLRAAVIQTGVAAPAVDTFDTGSAFPTATPVEERFDPAQPILGGRLRLTGEALTLTRSNSVVAVDDPSGVVVAGPQPYLYEGVVQTSLPTPTAADPTRSLIYRDSRSADAEANWQSDLTFTSGIRIKPFADVRFDAFSINEGQIYQLSGGAPLLSAAPESDARALGSVGADLSWPFIKPLANGSIVLEPLAQLIYANRLKYNPDIPNEDSVSFEFDETTLFELNRFSGYDLAESGARANLGFRATLDLDGGRSASGLIGRTFRASPDPEFTPQSGLQDTSSDWVTAVSLTPIKGFTVFNRARFAGNDWTVHREEAGLNFAYGRLSGSIRYVYEQNGFVQVDCTGSQVTLGANNEEECPSPFGGGLVPADSSVIGAVENAEAHLSWFFLKNWGVTVNATHDFVGYEVNNQYHPVWPMAQLGLTYLDECIRVDLIYTHEEYYSATIGPSDSIALRLTLTTLGGTLGAPAAARQGSR